MDFSKRYEYVVIDTGGRDSKELRSALIVADIFITPIKPSQVDIDTLGKMNELVQHASTLNKKLMSSVIITHAPTNPGMEDKDETQAILKELPNFSSADTIITYRSCYWRTMGRGLSVLESTDEKAKEEILGIGKEIFNL